MRPSAVQQLEYALYRRDQTLSDYPPGDVLRSNAEVALQVVAAASAESVMKYIGELEAEIGKLRGGDAT